MMDIVIPNNNEEEFIAIAEVLGYKGLCFLYSIDEYLGNLYETKKYESGKIKIYKGILADSKGMSRIKSKYKKDKTFVAIRSTNNNDREIIEKLKPNLIFSSEDVARKDFIHQRASGINHILCKLAKENNVMMGFSLSSILNTEDKNLIFGRMMQNIHLFRKFKVKTIVASFARTSFEMRSTHDLNSLFGILGAKDTSFLKERDIN